MNAKIQRVSDSEHSREQNFQRTNVPWSESCMELFHGVKMHGISLPGVKLSLPGAKVLRSEKAIIPVHNVNNLIYNSLNEIYNK